MSDELKNRTKAFSLRVIKMVDRLPKRQVTQIVGNQILRSGTSVGANYRAACRARSKKEFIAKLGIVEEECDETIYWMELLNEGGWVSKEKIEPIKKEAEEILRIMVASSKTAKS
jgi:four helix bundle protein